MINTRQRLLSLVALRAFESVGRTGSIRSASEELSVSHTVVSRHVKNLQAQLGVMLVRQSGRGISLTAEGQNLFSKISNSFDDIERAVREARKSSKENIRIWCAPGIANRRLLGRLADLAKCLPRYEISFFPTLQRPDLTRREADVEIVYVNGEPTNSIETMTDVLAKPRVFPVASPAFMARYPNIKSAVDLVGAPLIHEESTLQWQTWLRAAGVAPAELHGQRLWHAHLSIESAKLGNGIALANEILVHDEISDGSLIEPFPSNVVLGHYVLVALGERWSTAPIVSIRSWLRETIV